MSTYHTFLNKKTQANAGYGFNPVWMPTFLFSFQSELVSWAIRQGRAAIFADCGLGKTAMQLVWAENVVRKTGGCVLVLTPLAVSAQIVEEGEKFGIKVTRSNDGSTGHGITVTNYERLHLFNAAEFAGVVCDESSILKSFDGARRQEITVFMRKIPYRLLATATAAPNDYTELGTSSEALGYLGHMDMLNRFFKNDLNNSATGRMRGEVIKWRFKGHAETPFWQWVCSWARAVRRPSDLGHDDTQFVLPPLYEREHILNTASIADGWLFAMPAVGLKEQRDERKRTIPERCDWVSQCVNRHTRPFVVWCHLNEEATRLAKAIPDAVEVSGNDSAEEKEHKLLAFTHGEVRGLITKPKIGAWGLNWQHCADVVTFPSHSFEQYYQSVRRCWRFGQQSPVTVDIVASEGERGVLANLQAKAAKSDLMFSNLVREMSRALTIDRAAYGTRAQEVPSWL